jgi:hypothetical protein
MSSSAVSRLPTTGGGFGSRRNVVSHPEETELLAPRPAPSSYTDALSRTSFALTELPQMIALLSTPRLSAKSGSTMTFHSLSKLILRRRLPVHSLVLVEYVLRGSNGRSLRA